MREKFNKEKKELVTCEHKFFYTKHKNAKKEET